jgi:hypothetical protein
MSYGTVQAEKMTTESGYSLGAGDSTSFKNKLINGDMRIDQRNAGASVSVPLGTSQAFVTDRWFIQNLGTNSTTLTCSQSTDAPVGYKYSLLVTNGTGVATTSSDSRLVAQYIEGLNIIDLAFGTASAKGITLSFQVKSSLTGTFSGCVLSNSGDQVYGFTFAISSANTWTTASVSIPGSVTGTWPTGNEASMRLQLNLGSGNPSLQPTANVWASSGGSRGVQGTVNLSETTGATFRITAVQIEVGTVATSFDFRSYGTELQLCQRYFQSFSYTGGTVVAIGSTFGTSTGAIPFSFYFPMRTTPSTVTLPAVGNTSGQWTVLNPAGGFPGTFGTITLNSASQNNMRLDFTGYTGVFASSGQAAFLYASGSTTTVVTASAEL